MWSCALMAASAGFIMSRTSRSWLMRSTRSLDFQLVSEITGGRAGIEYETARPDYALASLTWESSSRFWPSPDDIRSDLDELAPFGKYDSIFVFWPQRDLKNGTAVPCDAWGLAIGASESTNGATYAAIAN